MKFTEYLTFAILLIPTATVLTAAVICLTPETSAPATESTYTTVLSAHWGDLKIGL